LSRTHSSEKIDHYDEEDRKDSDYNRITPPYILAYDPKEIKPDDIE